MSGPDESLTAAWMQLRESLEDDLRRYAVISEIAEQNINAIMRMREDGLITEETMELEVNRSRQIMETVEETQATIAGWIEEGDVFYR